MDTHSQSAFPNTADVQTLQPRLCLLGPVVLLIVFGTFPLFFFLKHGINRVLYCGVSIFAVFAVLFRFRKEYQLVHDRLTAAGVVTDYGMSFRASSRFVRFIMRKFSPDVPVVTYSFTAFDQKTYTGKTGGWLVRDLYKGAKIVILYRPGKPSLNHPLTSFIFYTFEPGKRLMRVTGAD